MSPIYFRTEAARDQYETCLKMKILKNSRSRAVAVKVVPQPNEESSLLVKIKAIFNVCFS